MRIYLGMITKRLEAPNGLLQFVANAEKYGHTISKVVITCSKGYDEGFYNDVNSKVPLEVIDTNNPVFLQQHFARHGISRQTTQELLQQPFCEESGMLPYGFNRNLVLMTAIAQNADVLIFIDSDVMPAVLTMKNGIEVFEEVDFIGRHMEYLETGSWVTLSEYSGYNILPEARFDGMEHLLRGVQKEDMCDYWKNSFAHHCIALQEPNERPEPGRKLLGGNVGFRLEAFSVLPPFFSSYYTADDSIYLARGEDTVLSIAMAKGDGGCVDIKTHIFHDTYSHYPSRPNLAEDPAVQSRFYYACTGWIGRNPFLNYILGRDVQAVRRRQKESLAIGAKALAEYTGNPCFLTLPEKFEISWDSLPRYREEYNRLQQAWSEFVYRGTALQAQPARLAQAQRYRENEAFYAPLAQYEELVMGLDNPPAKAASKKEGELI